MPIVLTRLKYLFLCSLLCSGFVAISATTSPTFAQSDKIQKEQEQTAQAEKEMAQALEAERKAKAEEKAAQKAHRAKIEKVYGDLENLTKGLSTQQRIHFEMIYMGHNLIETVRVVEHDVKNAIKECGNNNTDMKDRLNARFSEWNSAISPVMSEASGHIKNMINAQAYAPATDVRKVMKDLNAIREDTNSRITKIPVTTPEACEFLLNKMEETQDSMISLLKAALITVPQDFEDKVRAMEKDIEEVSAKEDSTKGESTNDTKSDSKSPSSASQTK